jgi:hypothetical protein
MSNNNLPTQVVNALQSKNIGFSATHSSNVATLPQYVAVLKRTAQIETVDITSRSTFSKDADAVFGALR